MHFDVTIKVTTADNHRYVITDHPHPDVVNIVEENYDAYNRKWEEIGCLRTISLQHLAAILDAARKVKELRNSTPAEEKDV